MKDLNKKYVKCTNEKIFKEALLILNTYSSLVCNYNLYRWKGKNSVLIILSDLLYYDSNLLYNDCEEITYEDLVSNY